LIVFFEILPLAFPRGTRPIDISITWVWPQSLYSKFGYFVGIGISGPRIQPIHLPRSNGMFFSAAIGETRGGVGITHVYLGAYVSSDYSAEIVYVAMITALITLINSMYNASRSTIGTRQ